MERRNFPDCIPRTRRPGFELTVLTLVHNEAGIIEEVVREIHRKILSHLPGSELVVVEDGSTDGTKEILSRLKDELNFTLLMDDGKQGYTAALRQAFLATRNRGEYIFFTDSDGQHDQEDFWKLHSLIGESDMVIGVKEHRQDSWFRNTISHVMNRIIVPWLFRVRLRDINCGFRILRKEVVDFLLEEDWLFRDCVFSELTLRAARSGFRITETPVRHSIRRSGTSSGLPTKKMPVILSRIGKNFLKLRREFSRKRMAVPPG